MKFLWIINSVFWLLFLLPEISFCQNSKDVKDGDRYYNLGRFDSAVVCYQKAIENKNADLKNTEIIDLLGKTGNSYEELGDYNKAFTFYREALNNATEGSYYEGIANSYNHLGNIYYRWGSFEKAMIHYKNALKTADENNLKNIQPSIFNNIGNIYYSFGEYELSLEHYKAALDTKLENNDSVEIESYLINIGSSYLGMKNYKEALSYYNKSLEIANRQNNQQSIANCFINIGYLFNEQKEYNKAIDYYNKAIKIIEKTQSKLILAIAFKNLGESNKNLGNIQEAIFYLKSSMIICYEGNLNEQAADVYSQLSTIYESEGSFKEALYYQKKYKEMTDSVFNRKSHYQISELRAEYESEKKELEIAEKDQQIAENEKSLYNQKIIFTLGILILLAISIIAFMFFRNREHKKRVSLESEIDKQMQLALSAQMNPHFISNALNSIQKYFLNNDIEKANGYLADFGALIRTVLANSREMKISVGEEIKSIELYLSLEALRLDNKFTYQIQTDENLDVSKTLVPSLIIQPLVENAIWHGIAPMEGKGHISISFKLENNNLVCTVIDNGIGLIESARLKQQTNSRRKSFGLEINKKRIELLNGSEKTKMDLRIEDMSVLFPGQTGTLVEFKIPQQ
ncbi:MAG: hypothetical protein A2W91_12665 [Bacteroidetes bacterium GWF2_38_335]|nr:MAG: hypothetical protein A2W91_12665 [Bacteroidetes bacterium GWF2_38_335]OFY77019.1 MAG: hypothetical protein A2281_00780 [Bacteroidetes bacterium RIFOXYA12_FULL_38_20]HBS86877.1 hypothetical protein [Bacteroidales bacterium]